MFVVLIYLCILCIQNEYLNEDFIFDFNILDYYSINNDIDCKFSWIQLMYYIN